MALRICGRFGIWLICAVVALSPCLAVEAAAAEQTKGVVSPFVSCIPGRFDVVEGTGTYEGMGLDNQGIETHEIGGPITAFITYLNFPGDERARLTLHFMDIEILPGETLTQLTFHSFFRSDGAIFDAEDFPAKGGTKGDRVLDIRGTFTFGGCSASGTFERELFGGERIVGTWSVDFALVSVDPDGFRWATNDGDFGTASNWDPMQAPDSSDLAIFDRLSEYTVTMGSVQTLRLLVENGDVTFIGSQYSVVGGSATDPSVVVGNTAAGPATLRLNGVQLLGDDGTIGKGAGTNGTLRLTNSAEWRNVDVVKVGDDGMGELFADASTLTGSELHVGHNAEGVVRLFGGATATTGRLMVGLSATGTIEINAAGLTSEISKLGVMEDGHGTATVDNGLWDVNGDLIVGDAGMGDLNVFNGGNVDVGTRNLTLGKNPGSFGEVLVAGVSVAKGSSETPSEIELSELFVGSDGRGNLEIAEGGHILAGGVDIKQAPSVGAPASQVKVVGKAPSGRHSILDVVSDLVVGGNLFIQDDGDVKGSDCKVGASFESSETGGVHVDNAVWTNAGDVQVGEVGDTNGDGVPEILLWGAINLANNGAIHAANIRVETGSFITGNGTFFIPSPGVFSASGTIEPGVSQDAPLEPIKLTEHGSKQDDTSIGMLTIDGDLVMNGGVLRIEVAGLGEGSMTNWSSRERRR